MPNYEYDKDYPFAAFITNLGKYNEGELVGEWVKFPTTADELKKVFERIGIGQSDRFGQPYEEWFITDYDCYVGGLYKMLGEYENLDELNYLASKLDDMDRTEYNQFLAAMELGDHTGSVRDLINLTENLDCYDVYPDIEDYEDLGRYYIEELDAVQIPDHLRNYIDYEAFGRDVALDEGGAFTKFGYVRDTGDRFQEIYDGDRDSIPEEYRVMTFQDEEKELSEEDKLDMVTDLAYDLDEFFRQHDPQYAAEHPEPQEQKEVIAELLMEGKTAAIRQRLEEMAQGEEVFLPGRMSEFERETGYDPKQDTSVEEDRTLLTQPQEQPDDHLTGEQITTPRGIFYLTDLSRQQMEAAGYGLHHDSEDQKYHIMANGTRAYAVRNENVPEKMTVLVVEPMKEPYAKVIDPGYRALQKEVDGLIQAVYPYEDPVAIVCNDEGKLMGMELNRALRDEDGQIYDIVAGTFLVVGIDDDDFGSLSPDMVQKYTDLFKQPEQFLQINGRIVAIPVEPENPLRTAEMTLEDDYGMIDGVINNGRRGEEVEKAREATDKKSSIKERLDEAKHECAERKGPELKHPDRSVPEHGDL